MNVCDNIHILQCLIGSPLYVFVLYNEKNVSSFPGSTESSGVLADIFLSATLRKCRSRL